MIHTLKYLGYINENNYHWFYSSGANLAVTLVSKQMMSSRMNLSLGNPRIALGLRFSLKRSLKSIHTQVDGRGKRCLFLFSCSNFERS